MTKNGSSGAAGPAPATEPYTPHRHRLQRPDPGINGVIMSLESEWHIGLRIRGEDWSPTTSSTKDLADKVYGVVKRLWWSSRPALHKAIANFNELAPQFKHEARLDLLHKTLNSVAKPISRAGIPKNNPPKILHSSFSASKDAADDPFPANSLFCRSVTTDDDSNPTGEGTHINSIFKRGRTKAEHAPTAITDQSDSRRRLASIDAESWATAVEPGSPTDVDTDADDEFVTSPSLSLSPSPSSRSARRKLKASTPMSSRPLFRNRPSDSSEYSDPSLKLTRTSKGKAPVTSNYLFKVPSIDLLRSLQAGGSVASSAKTSFTNTVNSSQEATSNTVNTSFTSYDGASEPERKPRFTRTSSTTLGSLSDHEFLHIAQNSELVEFEATKQRELGRFLSQDVIRDSTSTFGSIDEEGMQDVSQRLEATTSRYADATSTTKPFPPPGQTNMDLNLNKPFLRPRSTSVGAASTEPPQTRARARAETPLDSPTRQPFYIRQLPEQNLFFETLSDRLSHFPFFILFICCRLAIFNGTSLDIVLQYLDSESVTEDREIFWQAMSTNVARGPRESKAVWAASKKSFDGYTFKAKVVFDSKIATSRVFNINLLPIEPEKSCLFQRMFGSDRFLFLSFPSFTEDKPDRFNHDQMQKIADQWMLWLMQPHSFLGRTWRVFHIEPIKKKGTRRDSSVDKRVILFATEGHGIDTPMSIGEMLNRFIDLKKNQAQSFCKIFARLDLGLSKTIPTITFKPSQIRRVRDVLATQDPDSVEFNDATLRWSERCQECPVMNDGCSRISAGAMMAIWKKIQTYTGSRDPLPSAIQGRIAGAKGMWMISSAPQSLSKDDQDIWIEISDSQLKFDPTADDENDDTFDPHRLTFSFVKHSFVNGSSDLHISFIPILENRGVSRNVLVELIKTGIGDEREQLLQTLDNPVRLHNWIAKQSSCMSDTGLLPWEAALPASLSGKAKLLLRSGFAPDQSPYLAKQIRRFVRQRQLRMEEKLRSPLGMSTFLIGLADPGKCLEPGQVHIHFSSPFYDEISGSTFLDLNGLDVLLARQPALRPSDMQKARVISHPKLSHLVDVVVFSCKGPFPLAGKLQGGDYDGDTFWVCWEPKLVVPFKNAPAPLNAPKPAKYGIQKDVRKLNQVMDVHNLASTDGFLREALTFRTKPSLLGKATNFCEKVAYQQNRVSSTEIDALCDVHDLLVDAPKQGYVFDDGDFTKFVRFKLKCGRPKVPAYKEAMEMSAKARDYGECDVDPVKSIKHNPKNIIDHLYFRVIRKHNFETCKILQAALPKEEDDDPDLKLPYLQLREKGNGILSAELDALIQGFDKILHEWNRCINAIDRADTIFSEKYTKIIETCYQAYQSLVPSAANASHPEIAPLIYSYLGPSCPTLWVYIRASALYTRYPKRTTFVWQMAGKELAQLRTSGISDTYNIVPAVFADLKTKPRKLHKREEDEESDDELESVLEHMAV